MEAPGEVGDSDVKGDQSGHNLEASRSCNNVRLRTRPCDEGFGSKQTYAAGATPVEVPPAPLRDPQLAEGKGPAQALARNEPEGRLPPPYSVKFLITQASHGTKCGEMQSWQMTCYDMIS